MNKILKILTLSIIAAISSHAADMQKLVQDIQKMTQEGATTNLVWWMPSEFWVESLRQSPHLTDEQKKDFVAALDDYSAFAVANIQVGFMGGLTSKSREEILKNVSLHVGSIEIDPIPFEELTPDARSFYEMMKPMMGQMMGQFGQGMEFIIYPNKKDGELIINPLKEGSFTYTSFGQENVWRLPLGSLLSAVWDPKTEEVFPGNYKFNPFTGSKLSTK